jgi:hypothetical protein
MIFPTRNLHLQEIFQIAMFDDTVGIFGLRCLRQVRRSIIIIYSNPQKDRKEGNLEIMEKTSLF